MISSSTVTASNIVTVTFFATGEHGIAKKNMARTKKTMAARANPDTILFGIQFL